MAVRLIEWEYKIVTEQRCNEEYINALGRAGWELKGIANHPEGPILYFMRMYYPPGQDIII